VGRFDESADASFLSGPTRVNRRGAMRFVL
jgi:hypothetical protein